MAKEIVKQGEMMRVYLFRNIGWEGFVGVFIVGSFLLLGQA
jgi:hypothetical protein